MVLTMLLNDALHQMLPVLAIIYVSIAQWLQNHWGIKSRFNACLYFNI